MTRHRLFSAPPAALTAAMATLAALLCSGCATAPTPSRELLVQQVTAAETAFAQTMAARDHAAFMRFVAEEAVFLGGGNPLRGKAAVAAGWQRFFTAPEAPFAWKPDRVEVLASGTLAQTTGPVSNAQGKTIARFYSTWRLEDDGRWRVVFDDGYDVCDCPRTP